MVYNFCEKCEIRGKRLQYLAVFGANIGIIAEGMHYGWASVSIPILISGNFTIHITAEESSILISMIPMGSVVGSILGELTMDLVGRRNSILISAIPLVISWLCLALGTLKYFYYVSRFLAGFAEGLIYTAFPTYIAEISDPDIRGRLSSTINVFLVFGMLLINVLYFFLNDSIVLVSFIAAIIALVSMFIMLFMPESPYFYIQNRNMEAAEISLKALKGKEDVSEELSRIYTGIFNELEIEGKEREEACLLLRRYKKCLLISTGLALIQNMSGIMAIESYCETIFLGQNYVYPKIANIIYFITYFISTLNSIFWVDFCGRKPLILFSISLSCLALFLNAVYLMFKESLNLPHSSFESIELFSVLIFTSAYSLGLHSIPILVTSEIYPTNLKSTAQCISNLIFCLISTGVIIMFDWFTAHQLQYVPFLMFSLNCFLGVLFIIKFVPETKHKTLEEIQIDLKRF